MLDWMEKSTVAPDIVPAEMKYALFIDESGVSGYNHDSQYFTLCSCIFEREAMIDARQKLSDLKLKYWPQGEFPYKDGNKRVVLHLRDISQAERIFNKGSKLDKNNPFCMLGKSEFDSFYDEMLGVIHELDFTVISATIDKHAMRARYGIYAFDPYNVASTFILERVRKYLMGKGTALQPTVSVILEARGEKEDCITHRQIMKTYKYGSQYLKAEDFRWIHSVYFCKKHDGLGRSYYGLEIADLCAYPIKMHFVNPEQPSLLYELVHGKVYRHDTDGEQRYGLKLFP